MKTSNLFLASVVAFSASTNGLLDCYGILENHIECTVEAAIAAAEGISIHNVALFWKKTNRIGIAEVEYVARAHGRKLLRDVFAEPIRQAMLESCAERNEDGWNVLSKAFGTMASGVVWALVPKESLEVVDPHFESERTILKDKGLEV